jgi:hypothetical protein
MIYMQQTVTEYFDDPQLGGWDGPNSCAILRELFSSSHSTAAIMDLYWAVCVQCVGDLYLNSKYELYRMKLTCVSTNNVSEMHNIFDFFPTRSPSNYATNFFAFCTSGIIVILWINPVFRIQFYENDCILLHLYQNWSRQTSLYGPRQMSLVIDEPLINETAMKSGRRMIKNTYRQLLLAGISLHCLSCIRKVVWQYTIIK